MSIQQAKDAANGHFVLVGLEGTETLCLKGYRVGKEFLTNYLVPLDPLPCARDHLALVYMDPEEALEDCAAKFAFDLGPAAEGTVAEVGDVLINDKGRFLKVRDADSHLRHFAYMNLDTGEVMRRQERNVSAVHREWNCAATGADPRKSLFGKLKKKISSARTDVNRPAVKPPEGLG